MNKKVKSLLIAGLLVGGMSGNTFANGGSRAGESTSTPVPVVSEIRNPEFKEGENERVIELQDGKVVLTITKTEEGNYLITTKWDSTTVKVISVKTFYENEFEVTSETQFKDEEDCDSIIKGENGWYEVNLSDLIKSKLVKIEVKLEAVKGQEPVTPPTDTENPTNPGEKEEIKEEIATGDASSMPIVATAIASAVGLYVLNKKEDEE